MKRTCLEVKWIREGKFETYKETDMADLKFHTSRDYKIIRRKRIYSLRPYTLNVFLKLIKESFWSSDSSPESKERFVTRMPGATRAFIRKVTTTYGDWEEVNLKDI